MPSWVFEFRRADGEKYTLDRMNPNVTDLLALLSGAKPLLYTQIQPQEKKGVQELAAFFGLRAHLAPVSGSRTRWRAFLAVEQDALLRAKALARAGRVRDADAEWSDLLGYPRCCSGAFAGAFEKAKEDLVRDVVPAIARQSPKAGSYSFLLNNVFNYSTRIRPGSPAEQKRSEAVAARSPDGASTYLLHVLPWHPCSYACGPSLELARRFWETHLALVPQFAERLRSVLGRPVLYFDKWEFLLLDGEVSGPGRARYRAVVPPSGDVPEAAAALIGRGDSLEVRADCVLVSRAGAELGRVEKAGALLLPFAP